MHNVFLALLFFLSSVFFLNSCGTQNSDDQNLYDFSSGGKIDLEDGMKAKLDGTSGILQYTRIWLIGSTKNITRIYFALHGDGISDYSDSTADDRREMAKALPAGEGAIVAYPISSGSRSWPAFTGKSLQRKNGPVLIQMFRQLAKSAGNENAIFEQFGLSGAGKVNMALLMLVLEKYDSSADVKAFVDDNFRGIHDGAALCYDRDDMVDAYHRVLRDHAHLRGTFIHNTKAGEEVDYGYDYHFKVAKLFKPDLTKKEFPKGGSLTLQNNRLRFWSNPLHYYTWKSQFTRVFLGQSLPSE